jgi:hypothetical protein
MNIFIWPDGKRCNLDSPYVTEEGVTHQNLHALKDSLGIKEITIEDWPQPQEHYYVQELDYPTGNKGYLDVIMKPASQIYEQELNKAKAQREAAYKSRSDVIALKVVAGRATQEELLAEIAAIKAEFPDPLPV